MVMSIDERYVGLLALIQYLDSVNVNLISLEEKKIFSCIFHQLRGEPLKFLFLPFCNCIHFFVHYIAENYKCSSSYM
jgi:hypothetical protein